MKAVRVQPGKKAIDIGVITPIFLSMVTTLRDEIKQNKPFESLEQEAQLNIIRTGSLLLDDVEQFLKPYGVTATQYNVLRILRGAHPAGLCRNELRDRMLTRMPDVTRLLDRMEEVGLVERERGNWRAKCHIPDLRRLRRRLRGCHRPAPS